MPESESPRVLIIDDDLVLLRMVRLSFQSEGFQVFTANDGLQGLQVLQSQEVDAVVVDLLMPRMDGRAFYREMRARGFDLPAIIVSAYGADAAREELRASSSMGKPFDPDLLIAEVRRLMSEHEARPKPRIDCHTPQPSAS